MYNERYIRDISRKIRASLRFKIERGEYLGNAPYGYVKSSESKNRLCVDQFKAGVVREIFELYKSGYGYSYIAKILNSKGVEPPTAAGVWNPVTVKRILSNPVYIGNTVQGISEKVSFKSKKTRRLPEDRWVVTEDTHEKIIGKDVFEEVQIIRKSRNAGKGAHKGEIHLFRDIVYCGDCGRGMFYRNRKNRPAGYICATYAQNGKNACSSHYVKENFLKALVCDELVLKLREKGTRKALFDLLQKDAAKASSGGEDIKYLEQLLTSKQRQQDTLYLDKLDGKISEQLFLRMNNSIENRISQLRNEIERKKKITAEDLDWYEILDSFEKSILEGAITNEMMRMSVKKITVNDMGIKAENCGDVIKEKHQRCDIEVGIEFRFPESAANLNLNKQENKEICRIIN